MSYYRCDVKYNMPHHTVEEPVSSEPNNWWRFEAYAIAGKHIAPVPSTSLATYDPWVAYRATEGQRRTVQPPYVPLLELARQLRFKRPFIPDPGCEPLISAFAAQYGLLGILPAVTLAITMPAEVTPSGESGRTKMYVRRYGEWESVKEITSGDLLVRPLPGSAGHGSALVWDWSKNKFVSEPLDRVVLPYFPALAAAGLEAASRIPLPGTPTFWTQYAEPLKHFCRWTVRFREAVEIVSRFYLSIGSQEPADPDPVNEALVFLEGLASCTGTPGRFQPGKRRFERELVSPSLLASYAEMFLRDLERGRAASRCATCERFFVSDEIRAQYCTPRCRNTMQRRRQRQRSS
jgi:hypothetical protein